MDGLRAEARTRLQSLDDVIPPLDGHISTCPGDLDRLWRHILSHESEDDLQIIENLLIARAVLSSWNPDAAPNEDDLEAIAAFYAWLPQVSLPSSEFADALEGTYSADEEKKQKASLTTLLRRKRQRFSLSLACLSLLNSISPILRAENAADLVNCVATFASSDRDPWTSSAAYAHAQALSQSLTATSDSPAFWQTLQDVLEKRIRPLFAKTKNPAITPAGRKNFHPIPRPRFDVDVTDPETKPWKFRDVYATAVVHWVLSHYLPADAEHLESHLSLLVPPILSLIDDDSLAFKTLGCNLLTKFVTPIRASESDILRRTNLSAVFDDALAPCLLSLPTLTPEDESIQILSAAYSALLLVLQTRYHTKSKSEKFTDDDKRQYTSRLVTLLRDSVIPSFHHVSSSPARSASAAATASSSTLLSSFPYPRLSTLLLEQATILVTELRIHTVKYLQDLIPLIYTTLSNPFAPAHPPLLRAGVALARAVILNAHPRVWRWRGEMLAAFCGCWNNLAIDASVTHSGDKKEFTVLKKKLRGVIYLLKLAVDAAARDERERDLMGDNVVDIGQEYRRLVDADEELKELLLDEIDVDDAKFF